MKVPKSKLLKLLQPHFESMGYTYFKDTIMGESGLFSKKIDDGLYVTIEITTSNLYYNRFTCDFYMAKTLNFANLYKGIMFDAYKRPGFLMEKEELMPYIHGDSFDIDIWWSSDSTEDIEEFKSITKIAEPRFINNFELRDRINNCEQAIKDYNRIISVYNKMRDADGLNETAFKYTPDREINNIPILWFKAAEFVLLQEKIKYSKNSVLYLAANAYRQHILDKIEL